MKFSFRWQARSLGRSVNWAELSSHFAKMPCPLTWGGQLDNLRRVEMLEAIEKLLILQDRDRKITRLRAESNNVEPERRSIQTRTTGSQNALEADRHRAKQIESDRKKLELEVESKKQKDR